MARKQRVELIEDYRPDLMRRRLREQYKERFFKLFSSIFDFGGSVTEEERFVIIKNIWQFGSFAVSRSPAPAEQFEQEMDLTFTKYAVDSYDYNLQPLQFHHVPLQASRAVSKKRLTIGQDGVIVECSDEARLHPGKGVAITANRYISQIVNAKMTINTNLLMHKLPYAIPADQEDEDAFKEMLRQVFSDTPAVFVPLSMGKALPQTLNLNAPYIIDKLEAYVSRLENQFMDEIGVDNAKPVQGGQDRLLLDEVNANNAAINLFKKGIFGPLQAGFAAVETLFGRKITCKPDAAVVVSVHEDANGKGSKEADQDQAQGESED